MWKRKPPRARSRAADCAADDDGDTDTKHQPNKRASHNENRDRDLCRQTFTHTHCNSSTNIVPHRVHQPVRSAPHRTQTQQPHAAASLRESRNCFIWQASARTPFATRARLSLARAHSTQPNRDRGVKVRAPRSPTRSERARNALLHQQSSASQSRRVRGVRFVVVLV